MSWGSYDNPKQSLRGGMCSAEEHLSDAPKKSCLMGAMCKARNRSHPMWLAKNKDRCCNDLFQASRTKRNCCSSTQKTEYPANFRVGCTDHRSPLLTLSTWETGSFLLVTTAATFLVFPTAKVLPMVASHRENRRRWRSRHSRTNHRFSDCFRPSATWYVMSCFAISPEKRKPPVVLKMVLRLRLSI